MKKPKLFTLLTLCCILLLSIGNFNSGSADDRMVSVTQDVGITLFRNGIPVVVTTRDGVPDAPILYEGTTYIRSYGLRQLFGYAFTWDTEQTVTVSDAFEFITVPLIDMNAIDTEATERRTVSNSMNISRKVQVLPVEGITLVYEDTHLDCTAPILVLDKEIYLPLRDVGNLLGWAIQWNNEQRGVDIMSKEFAVALETYLKFDTEEVLIPREDTIGFRAYLLTNVFHDSSTCLTIKGIARRNQGVESYYINIPVEKAQAQISRVSASRKAVAEITESLNLFELSPRERVLRINEYICNRFTYDFTISESNALEAPRTLTRVLSQEKQICEGYARLFMEMCRAADVPCQYLLGYVNQDGRSVCHAWNRVYVDGQWLYCDATLCDSSKKKDVGLLVTETEMVNLHDELSMAVRY